MPTREEMIAALQGADSPQPGQAPSREEMIAALEGNKAPAKDAGLGVMDKLKTAAGYGLRGLDYAGGLARTGAAGAVQLRANAMGKVKELVTGDADTTPQVVTTDDAIAALKGQAPSIGEYLKRSGMGEGGRLSDVAPIMFSKDPGSWRPTPGGNFDPTTRGAVGMAGDIALDPLTYLGAGPLKGLLPKGGMIGKTVDHVLNPAENVLLAGGKATYISAPIMKAADALNERFGKDAASDILFNQGITGTGRGIATKAEALANKTGLERNALLSEAGDGVMDMNKAMSPAEDFIAKIRASADPQLTPVADALEGRIKEYKALNPATATSVTREMPSGILNSSGDMIMKTATEQVPEVLGRTPLQGSGFKSSLYNDTGNAAWDSLRKTPQGDLGNKALARGLNAETSAAAERALPGAGQKVDALNDTWGALLTPRKVLEAEAIKGEKKNLLTSVDGLTIGLTHGNPVVLGAKKLTEFLKTNVGRTNGGLGAYTIGEKTPMLDEILRRQMINQSQPQSEWEKLRK